MTNASQLPERPSLDWYRKAAKQRLEELRGRVPGAKLADAQLALAREYGFASWRALKAEIDRRAESAAADELFAAIRRDDFATMRRLLEAQPQLVSAKSGAGESPLHLAAEVNNPDTIDLLFRYGADSKSLYGKSAHTALSWALTTAAFEAADALVRHGVKPDLFCAAGMGALDAVQSFFDARDRVRKNASQTGSSRFAPDGSRLPTPSNTAIEVVSDALYFACRNARVNVARFLLARDVSLEFRGFLGGTLLHWAHFGGSAEIVAMLLAAGADPAARDPEFDCTPRAFGICVPASWGLVRSVADRLKADKSLAAIHDGRGTPLHEAAREGHESIVRLLLACGADRTVLDRDGKSAWDLALAGGHASLRGLLESDTDPGGR